jgi:hypothetical protein
MKAASTMLSILQCSDCWRRISIIENYKLQFSNIYFIIQVLCDEPHVFESFFSAKL